MGDAKPILIEVAINEAVTRAQHRFVPVTPEECAADAIASVRAGASFAHWHAPDLAAYATAWRAMRAADVIAYPSYPNEPPDDVDARLGHCFELALRDGLEMAPLDLGTAHTILWDGERLGGGGTLANPLAFLERAAARYARAGVIPNLASFDLGHTRLAVRLARAGFLEPPLVLKIYLSDTWLVGPTPSRASLDLHLAELPDDLEIDWLVVPFLVHARSTFETLCRHALERGGGFRVGIGDNPALFPDARNAELVEQVQPWIEASGRRVATTRDVRMRRRGATATA
ncbi:MAG: 3-keto-5-aminohexanoate cleavage protein [Myxococcota bacterium]